MSGLPIVKMSGAGNDFVVIDARTRSRLGDRFEDWVRSVCRRGVSVGADGVLVVTAVEDGRVRVDFRNPDGSEAFCGNGSRCAARYASARGLAGQEFTLETQVGPVAATVRGRQVTLVLPAPRDLGARMVEVAGIELRGRQIDSGCPHFVVETDDVASAPLEVWGPAARSAPTFGRSGANVDLVSTRPDGAVAIRTWERGVEGETLACGSGTIAAAFVRWLDGGPPDCVFVTASGERIAIAIAGERDAPESVTMTGEARFVFEGSLSEEA